MIPSNSFATLKGGEFSICIAAMTIRTMRKPHRSRRFIAHFARPATDHHLFGRPVEVFHNAKKPSNTLNDIHLLQELFCIGAGAPPTGSLNVRQFLLCLLQLLDKWLSIHKHAVFNAP